MPSTVTIEHPNHRDWVITIIETSVSNGETVAITPSADEKFPKTGRLLRLTGGLASGSATTVAPILSEHSTFREISVIAEASPAVTVDESDPGEGIPYSLAADTFYHRSNPNAGADNITRTRYLIKEGW